MTVEVNPRSPPRDSGSLLPHGRWVPGRRHRTQGRVHTVDEGETRPNMQVIIDRMAPMIRKSPPILLWGVPSQVFPLTAKVRCHG